MLKLFTLPAILCLGLNAYAQFSNCHMRAFKDTIITSESLNKALELSIPQNISCKKRTLKRVAITIHVIQDDNGLNNFDQNNTSHEQFLLDVVAQVNTIFTHIKQPVWPVNGVPFVGDTKIRFELQKIYYHQNSCYWDFTGNCPNSGSQNILMDLGVNTTTELNIFLNEDTSNNFIGGYAEGYAHPFSNRTPSVFYKNAYSFFTGNHNYKIGKVSSDWAHELAHSLGIEHVGNGFRSHLCEDNDGLNDTPNERQAFFTPFHALLTIDRCSTDHSNNVMSYNLDSYDPEVNHRYFSKMQIDRMHDAFTNEKHGHYYKRYLISDCGYSPTITRHIEKNEIWTENRQIYGDLIVKSGNTLTIKCGSIISFAQNKKLIIEPGATVIITEQSVLTSCRGMWNGVEVWGAPSAQQNPNNQGRIMINSKAMITKARYGISTAKRGNNGVIDMNYSGGGIVEANQAIFVNNYVGIDFIPYQNMLGATEIDNLGYIKKSSFIIDDYLKDPSYQQQGYRLANKAFICANGIKGLEIDSSNFVNKVPAKFVNSSTALLGLNGSGVIGLNSDISITNSVFDGLNIAIDLSSNGFDYFSIKDCEFYTVNHAARIEGGFANLHSNTYNTYNNSTTYKYYELNPYLVGFSLSNPNGFEAYDNHFYYDDYYQSTNLFPFRRSVISNNSSILGGNIFRNIFEPLSGLMSSAIYVQTEDNNPNLKIECNEFHSTHLPSLTNLILIDLAINPQSPDSTLPSYICNSTIYPNGLGNKFISNSSCNISNRYQVYSPNSSNTNFRYRYAQSNLDAPDPFCVSNDVVLDNCASSVQFNPCATFGNFSINELKTKINQLQFQTEILLQLATKKQKTLQLNSVYNTPISEELKQLNAKKVTVYQQLIEAYLTNDNAQTSNRVNSIIQLLEEDNSIDFRKQLVPIYIKTNQIEKAQKILDGLPRSTFKSVQQFYLNLKKANRSIYELTSNEELDLREIATSDHSLNYHAKAILKVLYDENYVYEAEKIDINDLQEQTTSAESFTKSRFSIHPNPTSTDFTIKYWSEDLSTTITLKIYSSTGKCISSYKLHGPDKMLNLNTNELSSGIYICTLIENNQVIEAKKLIIQ